MDGRPEAQDMWRDAMGHLVAIEREAREVTVDGDLGHHADGDPRSPRMTIVVTTDGDPVQYFYVLSSYVPSKGPSKMSVVKLNPVDGLPEWEGRKVVTERRKATRGKTRPRFVMVEWGWLAKTLRVVDADRATRLLMVLLLHEKLRRTKTRRRLDRARTT